VPGRAPLQLRVRRPLHRLQAVGEQLRLAALQEVERHVGLDALVAGERLQRRVARGEGVHQHQRQPHAVARAQVEHLQRHDVEERPARLDLDERLRDAEAHARAEAAVELDDGDPVERGARPRVVELLHPAPHRGQALGPRPVVAQLGQHLLSRGSHRPRRYRLDLRRYHPRG
jgi:hypothetical protein